MRGTLPTDRGEQTNSDEAAVEGEVENSLVKLAGVNTISEPVFFFLLAARGFFATVSAVPSCHFSLTP